MHQLGSQTPSAAVMPNIQEFQSRDLVQFLAGINMLDCNLRLFPGQRVEPWMLLQKREVNQLTGQYDRLA